MEVAILPVLKNNQAMSAVAAVKRMKTSQTFCLLTKLHITTYEVILKRKKVKLHHSKPYDLTATSRKFRREKYEEDIKQYIRKTINKIQNVGIDKINIPGSRNKLYGKLKRGKSNVAFVWSWWEQILKKHFKE